MKTILIGGTGRSGTNILKDILSSHPKTFAFPFETRFTIDPDGIADFIKTYNESWSPYIIDRKIKRLHKLLNELGSLSSKKRYSKWELEKHIPKYKEYCEQLISKLVDFKYKASWMGNYSHEEYMYFCNKKMDEIKNIFKKFLNETTKEILDKNNAEIYVEDNTWNILFSDVLLEIMPDAYLIHMVRDPRDVIASLLKQSWTPSDLEQTIDWYKGVMNRWFEIKRRLNPRRFIEIKLEELVEKPKQILAKICEFVNIDFDESLLQIDLTKSHSGRWKTEFSEKEKSIINKQLNDYKIGNNRFIKKS